MPNRKIDPMLISIPGTLILLGLKDRHTLGQQFTKAAGVQDMLV